MLTLQKRQKLRKIEAGSGPFIKRLSLAADVVVVVVVVVDDDVQQQLVSSRTSDGLDPEEGEG